MSDFRKFTNSFQRFQSSDVFHKRLGGALLYALSQTSYTDDNTGQNTVEKCVNIDCSHNKGKCNFRSRPIDLIILMQEEHLAGVNRIIAQASVLEDADEVEEDHRRQEEVRKQSYETDFRNSKY